MYQCRYASKNRNLPSFELKSQLSGAQHGASKVILLVRPLSLVSSSCVRCAFMAAAASMPLLLYSLSGLSALVVSPTSGGLGAGAADDERRHERGRGGTATKCAQKFDDQVCRVVIAKLGTHDTLCGHTLTHWCRVRSVARSGRSVINPRGRQARLGASRIPA